MAVEAHPGDKEALDLKKRLEAHGPRCTAGAS